MRQAGETALPARTWLLLYAAALAVSFAVYAPSLGGPFVSDDVYYLGRNRAIREPSVTHLVDILSPRSDLTLMVANYAPVHLLVHTAQWQLFGEHFFSYHATNLALHAANALLLAALLLRAGLGRWPAILGAAFFLVHPANVEAVAWISQVKTQVAMTLMLVALLAWERRVALGSLAFALSLGAKATSAVALPVAAAWDWIRGERPARGRARATLLAWTAIFAAFALVQVVAFRHTHRGVEPVSDSLAVQLWTSAAIGARYVWMAAASLGISAYQEPPVSASPLEPWALSGIALGLALAARAAWALRRRREEAAWWIWAAASFGPVAQLFPFLYPMADRYLYFILPGLIGGTLLCGSDLAARIPAARRAAVGRTGVMLACAVVAAFAVRSHDRARIWGSEARVFADAVRHYPDGALASFVHARQAAAAGDVARAVEYARRSTRRGHRDFEDVVGLPEFAALRGRPELEAFLRERARHRIERIGGAGRLNVSERLALARAYLMLDEPARAVDVLRDASAERGTWGPEVGALRAEAQRAQTQATGTPTP